MNKELLDLLKIGYFIHFRSEGGFFGNSIEREQRKNFSPEDAKYTHVGVSLGGQHMIEVAPPHTKAIDIEKKHTGRWIRVTRFKGPQYAIKRYKVAIWSATLNNLKYDWLGIIKFRLKFLFHRKRKFFYPTALYKEPHEWMPADTLSKEFFETVYEGFVG